jgi:hypothetical protein
LLALRLAREFAVLDQRVKDVDLADRDEVPPILRRARLLAVDFDLRHGSAL